MSGDGNSDRDDLQDEQGGQEPPEGGQQPRGGGQQPPQGGGQQPRGGGQQPPQGGGQQPSQGGGQYAGQQYGGTSIVDDLQRPEPMSYIKQSVGGFAVLGFGYLLTAFLTITLINANDGTKFSIGSIGVFMGFFLGTVVAMVVGTNIAENLDEDDTTAAVTSLVSCAAGGFVLGIWLLIFGALLPAPGGQTPGYMELGKLFGPLFGALIGIAITGGLTTLAMKKLSDTGAPVRR